MANRTQHSKSDKNSANKQDDNAKAKSVNANAKSGNTKNSAKSEVKSNTKSDNAKNLAKSAKSSNVKAKSDTQADNTKKAKTKSTQSANQNPTSSIKEADFDFYTRIGFLAKRLTEYLSLEFSARIKELNLTHRECVVLWLCKRDKYSQIELSSLMCSSFVPMDKNYIRMCIDKLQQQGLLKRAQNPKNRRENLISLTKKGENLALRSYELMSQVHSDVILAHLGKQEYESLHRLLYKVVRALELEVSQEAQDSSKSCDSSDSKNPRANWFLHWFLHFKTKETK